MVAPKPASVAAAEKTQQKAALPSANGSSTATKTVAKASEPAKAAETRPSENKPAAPDEAARARALLEGREPPKSAGAESARFIVQVGAFSDATKAREARMKVERAGLKTYTQVVETADGKRIRVRVGPFGQRAEADKAAERIRKLDLPAALLTL
jgi:DedD protein